MPDDSLDIDYLSRDYASFRQLMLDELRRAVPTWTEDNPADFGHVLVEALAYLADYMSYYQDAVATEAYLGTARRRRSIRRHARLLDYRMHDGCNARVWAHFDVEGESDEAVPLARGAQLLTQTDSLPTLIRPGSPASVAALRPMAHTVFETMHDATLYPSLSRIAFFHAPGADPYLAQGSTSALLVPNMGWIVRGILRHPAIGDVLVFDEIRNPLTHFSAVAQPGHAHAVRVTDCRIQTISGVDAVRITWAEADALPFPLYVAKRDNADVSVAYGNVVLTDHGQTLAEERLPPVPAGERYVPHLRYGEITHHAPFDAAAMRNAPASAALQQEPHAALPAITVVERGAEIALEAADARPLLAFVRGGALAVQTGNVWHRQRELLSSNAAARDFVCEMDNNGRAYLRFGFGGLGRSPTAGTQFYATYRVGNGGRGNIGPDSLAHIITADPRIVAVGNALPAIGGVEQEPMARARVQAPFAFSVQQRCVIEEDYVTVAQRHPEVVRAVARTGQAGNWRTAAIYVQRSNGAMMDAAFKQRLADYMAAFRLIGFDIQIHAPHYVPVQIELAVTVAPRHYWGSVRQALEAAFDSTRTDGFFHPSRFTFGQPVYRSQIIARALAVEGVANVEIITFRRQWVSPDAADSAEVIAIQPLEIAVCANALGRGTISFSRVEV